MSRYIDADKLVETVSKQRLMAQLTAILILSMIKNTPTADVQEVRHGKWKKIKRENVWEDMVDVLQCSVCRKWKIRNEGIMKPSCYCPNCGAKMDLEAEE